MRRLACSTAAVAVSVFSFASGLLAQTPSSPQPPAVFRAGVDAVGVDAAVQRNGRPVIGLTSADFEILDNGVPQEITEIAYGKLPIDVTLLLDISASVTGDTLDELRRALRQVRADLGPGDRLRLLTFNMRVHRRLDFDQPAAALDEALASLRGEGSSAVFDSLAVALTSADAPGRRRLVVLFSDGQDSSSITDPATLLQLARRSTPTVATILASPAPGRPASLLRTTSAPEGATVASLFEGIAAETGGIVTAVKPGENLSSKFRRMVQEFRSSYVIYFTPRGVERGGAHTLDVRVKRSGVEVRARRGYIWP